MRELWGAEELVYLPEADPRSDCDLALSWRCFAKHFPHCQIARNESSVSLFSDDITGAGQS